MVRIVRPYHAALSAVSSGSTYDRLIDQKVDPGYILVVQHVSAENLISAFTSLRLGIDFRGSTRYIVEEKSPVGGEVYWYDTNLLIPEGSRLLFRFEGCTSGDHLQADFLGRLIPKCEDWGKKYE